VSIRDTGTRWEYDEEGAVVAWAAYDRDGVKAWLARHP